jgi:hypothetical protein
MKEASHLIQRLTPVLYIIIIIIIIIRSYTYSVGGGDSLQLAGAADGAEPCSRA